MKSIMIFLTVGTMYPFDRLINLVDDWIKGSNYIGFAQIGKSSFKPKNMSFKAFLDESEFSDYFNKSNIIISHAGMGTIITSLEHGKKLLTLPRLKSYGEHVNDHQLATTKALSNIGLIEPIYDEHDLLISLKNIDNITCRKTISKYANEEFLNNLKHIIR